MVKHRLQLAQTWHKKDLSYEFDFCVCVCVCVCVSVCVVGDLQKQQIDLGILTGCDEACLGMFKVLLNDELPISHEWVEVWKFVNVVGYIINSGISVTCGRACLGLPKALQNDKLAISQESF